MRFLLSLLFLTLPVAAQKVVLENLAAAPLPSAKLAELLPATEVVVPSAATARRLASSSPPGPFSTVSQLPRVILNSKAAPAGRGMVAP